MNRRCFIPSLLLVFLITLFTAQACGPDFYPDVFMHKMRPDNSTHFTEGKLGILLPTYPRADLTVAFRYLNGGSLSATEQKAYQPIYEYADPEWGKNWDATHPKDEKQSDPAELWSAARAKFAAPAPKVETNATTYVKLPNGATFHNDYSNCLGGALYTAVETLQSRAKTWGESSPDLADWLKGQDAVFANCATSASILPSAAPPGSSALLKADRAYQIAAAQFYSGQFDDARNAFETIARDSGSPWQGVARYLVARCLVRQAFSSKPGIDSDQMATFDSDLMKQAVTYLESLLKEKPQGVSRQSILDLLDLARLRSDPMAQLHLLSATLAGPKTDPRYNTHLSDLTWYLNAKLDQLPLREDTDLNVTATDSSKPFSLPTQAQKDAVFSKTYNDLADLRSSALLVDWLITFQSPAKEAKDHAIAEWKKSPQLYWLLAAITKATGKDAEAPDLVTAAGQVKPDSPAWESITYHRLRLLLALGKAQEARTLLDQTLPQIKAGGRDSSLSLFLGLRMRASANLNEALAYAPRKVLIRSSQQQSALNECLDVMKNPQRKYDCKKEVNPLQFSDDAAAFFNAQAPLSTLVEVAGSDALPMQLRQSVAMMAWVRAVLLHDDIAASKLFQLLPMKLQQQAGNGTGFHALVTLLRNPGLRPYLDAGVQRNYSYDFVESYRDNWWCGDWQNGNGTGSILLETNSVSFLTPAQHAEWDGEAAKLAQMNNAIVYLGGLMIDYAQSHPGDPDVPESLYLVLRMMRYECSNVEWRDETASRTEQQKEDDIRKVASRLLRQRYPASLWTKKAAPFASGG